MGSDRLSLPHRTAFLGLAALLLVVVAACGTSVTPTTADGQPSRATAAIPTSIAQTPSAAESSVPASAAVASAFADVPFAFPADSAVGFYEGEGLKCAAPVPSTKAAGWIVTTCQGADAAGRPIASAS